MYLLCNFLYNVKMKKGLPASLINFSLTSAVQSLHVFTATLTLSPVWITMPYLFIQLQPAHTAFTTVTINAHLMSEVSIFWFIVALWLSAALDFTFLMFITTCLRKKSSYHLHMLKLSIVSFFFLDSGLTRHHRYDSLLHGITMILDTCSISLLWDTKYWFVSISKHLCNLGM